MIKDDKVLSILKKGGSIVMHKNDLERLAESGKAGNKPDLFNRIKIFADRLGAVKEGEPIAILLDDSKSFLFRETFTHN